MLQAQVSYVSQAIEQTNTSYTGCDASESCLPFVMSNSESFERGEAQSSLSKMIGHSDLVSSGINVGAAYIAT